MSRSRRPAPARTNYRAWRRRNVEPSESRAARYSAAPAIAEEVGRLEPAYPPATKNQPRPPLWDAWSDDGYHDYGDGPEPWMFDPWYGVHEGCRCWHCERGSDPGPAQEPLDERYWWVDGGFTPEAYLSGARIPSDVDAMEYESWCRDVEVDWEEWSREAPPAGVDPLAADDFVDAGRRARRRA